MTMVQSRTRARVISKEVLKGLVGAGGLAGVIIAPNSLLLVDKYMKHIDRRNARHTLKYLKYRKLIQVKDVKGELEYKLTSKGWDKYEKIVLEELEIKTPRKWDYKWRLVMFDIPTYKRAQRDHLLQKLKDLNFYMLQQSAWIHPFGCEKQVGILLQILNLEKHVSYIVVEDGNFVDHATRYFQKHKLLL